MNSAPSCHSTKATSWLLSLCYWPVSPRFCQTCTWIIMLKTTSNTLLHFNTPDNCYCGFYCYFVFQTKVNSMITWWFWLPRHHREGNWKSCEPKIFQLTLKRNLYHLYSKGLFNYCLACICLFVHTYTTHIHLHTHRDYIRLFMVMVTFTVSLDPPLVQVYIPASDELTELIVRFWPLYSTRSTH